MSYYYKSFEAYILYLRFMHLITVNDLTKIVKFLCKRGESHYDISCFVYEMPVRSKINMKVLYELARYLNNNCSDAYSLYIGDPLSHDSMKSLLCDIKLFNDKHKIK